MLAFVLLLFIGLICIARASWSAIASGLASRSGADVEMRRLHPAFVQAVAPAQQGAMQQRTAQEQAARHWAAQHSRH